MGNKSKKFYSQMHPIRTLGQKDEKKRSPESANLLIFMVRQAGFEPATYGFVVRRSIRAELLALVKTV
jgi:hypothetical protein